MYRVVSVSRNVDLLLSRNEILAVAGFTVSSPKYPEQTADLARQQEADAVIIGHSIPPDLRSVIISEVRRQCPECVICFVYAAPERSGEPLADVSLDVTNGPDPLILALQERLPGRQTKSA